MLLKPFNSSIPQLPDEIAEILNPNHEVKDQFEEIEEKVNARVKTAREIFNKSGASVANIAQQVTNVMNRGETDAGRLRAAEIALKVHGILQELDEKTAPVININIIGSENKTLINLVLPT